MGRLLVSERNKENRDVFSVNVSDTGSDKLPGPVRELLESTAVPGRVEPLEEAPKEAGHRALDQCAHLAPVIDL
jgi:hypothetical protein